MSDGVIPLLFRSRSTSILNEFAIRLERGDDVELWQSSTGSSPDRPTVHHKSWAVETSHYKQRQKTVATIISLYPCGHME
jgi:hypothetical protein